MISTKHKVHLKDIYSKLPNVYVKVNNEFLRNIFCQVSSNTPYRHRKLSINLGCKFNEKYKQCSVIQNWYYGKRNIPLKKLFRLYQLAKLTDYKDLEKNIISYTSYNSNVHIKINFPLSISSKIGIIVGHILGDGSIDKKYNYLFFSNSNPELLKEFILCMNEIFDIKPRIWMQKKPIYGQTKWEKRIYSLEKQISGRNIGLFYPKICSIFLYALFGKFAFGKDKILTDKIIKANDEFKKGLIRSFFDDEASCCNRSIRVYQDNPHILKDISLILNELNIKCNPLRYYVKRNKKRYYFSITGYYNFIGYKKEIGFTSTKKLEKLNSHIKQVIKKKTYRLSCNIAKNNIFNILAQNPNITTSQIKSILKLIFPDLMWDNSTLLTHLSDLQKQNQVKKTVYKNTFKWMVVKC